MNFYVCHDFVLSYFLMGFKFLVHFMLYLEWSLVFVFFLVFIPMFLMFELTHQDHSVYLCFVTCAHS